jgi:hypothetical protein
VQFERTGYRLTSLGARVSLTARVYDAKRRAVPNAPIAWRITDSAVASVTTQGVVVSRRPGYTKVWAISGRDSASALILVDQWAAKFSFAPAVVRIDALGARLPLRVEMRDASGHAIPGGFKAVSCRTVDDRVADFTTVGDIVAKANGTTWVRCADRGVSDSVRVDVRQRPVRAVIRDKAALAVKTVGDTFHVALTAADRRNIDVAEVHPAWVSLTPMILTVDALTGAARALSPGDATIIGDVGDASDTLSINVRPGAGIVPIGPIVSADSSSTAARGPALNITPLFLALGDTTPVAFTARDATGTPILNPQVTLRSGDSTIIRVISQGRVVAVGKGTAYLVGQMAGLLDSTTINVRERGAISVTAAGSAASAFVRPTFDTAAARVRNQRELDSALTAIRRASAVHIYTGRQLGIAGEVGQAVHSSSPTENVVERRSGILYGGSVEAAPLRYVGLTGSFRTGSLTSSALTGEELAVTEFEGDITFAPTTWFGLRGGYVLRGESTPLATQNWQFARASAITRFTFVGGLVNTLTSVSILPAPTYSDTSYKASPFGLAGEAGLELHAGVLSMGLTYYVERLAFEAVNGFSRKDQFSVLHLRFGLNYRR